MGLPYSRNQRGDPKALTGPSASLSTRPTAAHANQGEEVRESGWKWEQTQKMCKLHAACLLVTLKSPKKKDTIAAMSKLLFYK